MKRRNFLSLSALAGITVLSPLALNAKDFRVTKPDVWTAHTVEDAIKNMYGDVDFIKNGIKLSAPKVASSGKSIPVEIHSDLSAKTVAVFQDINPEASVIVYTLHEKSLVEYSIKMKMKGSGTISVVLEGRDGKFYLVEKPIEVALGGCDP